MLPAAERDEVLTDLESEYRRRVFRSGHFAATRWIWRQCIGSLPFLFRRTWWRGMTGFEPRASYMRPGGPMLESWIVDFRYALRRLRRRPTYAALAVLTLALGAGGTAAVFSIMRTLILQPLPIAEESRVGVFWFPYSWNESEILYLRPNFAGFQGVAAYRPENTTLELAGAPLRLVEGMATSAEFFDVLGARPLLGQTFKPGDDVLNAEPVSVLSFELWRELGSDKNIVGTRLQLGGVSRTIIGVMPRQFWYPSPATKVWSAAQLNPQNRSGRYALVGRIAPSASIEHMEAPLQSIAALLGAQYRYPAQWDKTKAPAITPVREYLVGAVSPSLNATLAAMAVILLIASANVAALMLGQIDAQATDLAVRTALGADRRRLIQQLGFESLAIGVIAGMAGAAIAATGFAMLVQSLPLGDLAQSPRLDWTLVWASLAAALIASTIVAVIPAIAVWRGRLSASMAAVRTGGIAGRGGKLEASLVVVQMALAVLLTAGAGLLIRSVENLRSISAGVETGGLALVETAMPTRLDAEQRRRAVLEILPGLRALPGVTSVAASQKLPLRGSGDNWSIGIRGRTDVGGTTAFRIVTHDYLTTMGISIKSGRNFEASDRAGSERVVIVNEALAAKYFPNTDPIGQVLQTFNDTGERVIGVAANAAEANLTDPPVPARYMLFDQLPVGLPGNVTFVMKSASAGAETDILARARQVIERNGTQLAVQRTMTMDQILETALGPTGQVVTLLTMLAVLALALGGIGVYGVISHYVTRRSRDYGICIALGESPARVIRQVVGRGAALVSAGGAIGIVAALLVTRILKTLLYGVTATDVTSLVGAAAVLLVVGVIAAFIPARRASMTDPATVLRQS